LLKNNYETRSIEVSFLSAASENGLLRRIKRPDWALVIVALALIAGFVLPGANTSARDSGMIILANAFESLWQTAPYLLLSVGIAAYAAASGADNLIARVFQGRTLQMIIVASLFGALSPFCSCGVIPIIAALLSMGVPLAPVMAFWLASPIMDPSMFVMTSGVLGLDYAIAKTVAAIGIGLFGGLGILWLGRVPVFADPLRDGVGNGGCSASSVRSPKPVVWSFWTEGERIDKFRKSAVRNVVFLGKWMLVAFVLENLMLIHVPADMIASSLGGDGIAPIAIATLVGVPAYLNGYAALPLVAGLLEQGMAPGAAISFMIAGGVTCIPATIAVFALVKRPVFASYLGFALVGSFMAGLVFQAVMAFA